MFFGEEDSPIQNLPNEMIIEVLSLMDVEGKQSTRLVCRRWRWILDHPDAGLLCFKRTKGKMTKDSMQCLLKSELYIDLLELRDVKVTWPLMTYSRNKFPPIRHLSLGSGNFEQSMMTILQYGCAQTESLALDWNVFGLTRLDLLSRVLSGMRWNHLTELSLKAEVISDIHYLQNPQENNVEGIGLIFKKARIPNLRALSLELFRFGSDEFCTEITTLMLNFMTFLEHHSKILKELQFGLFVCPVRDGLVIVPNISTPLFSAEQQDSVARNLKLECLEISTTCFDALLHLLPPCVWGSENLIKLSWHQKRDNWWLLNRISTTSPGTPNLIQSLIQRNRNTLISVTTTVIHCVVTPFELSWLESCPHLRELTITSWDKLLTVQLRFPTVRKLDISLIKDFESVENTSAWIVRTFPSLQTVQFLVCLTPVAQNQKFDWIQNLLVLPRLGEIGFQFWYWSRYGGESCLHFGVPNLVLDYCSDKARLMFRGGKQRRPQNYSNPAEACLVKILPI